MKKVSFFLIFIFILVGCSSVTKEVDNLIEEKRYSEAAELIEKNDLLNKQNEDAKYDYNSLVTYLELQKLYEEAEYHKVLNRYTVKPVNDKFIENDVIKLVQDSFDALISKGNFGTVETFYDKLDADSRKNFEEVYLTLLNLRVENQETKVPGKLDQYLKYMEEGNYTKLVEETATDLTIAGNNFFNLGQAYNNFYYNNNIVYIEGEESLPEAFINSISESMPEAEGYISKLRQEIDARKKGAKGNFGVSIGMTQDMVLKSSWGKPIKINKTTTKYGVREQWVYENYNYLYFEDGILTGIQN